MVSCMTGIYLKEEDSLGIDWNRKRSQKTPSLMGKEEERTGSDAYLEMTGNSITKGREIHEGKTAKKLQTQCFLAATAQDNRASLQGS